MLYNGIFIDHTDTACFIRYVCSALFCCGHTMNCCGTLSFICDNIQGLRAGYLTKYKTIPIILQYQRHMLTWSKQYYIAGELFIWRTYSVFTLIWQTKNNWNLFDHSYQQTGLAQTRQLAHCVTFNETQVIFGSQTTIWCYSYWEYVYFVLHKVLL